MENQNIVNPDLINQQPQEGKTPQVNKEEGLPPVPAGSKTDSELLLKSLQEEREKRRMDAERFKMLEEEIETLKTSAVSEEAEAFSDEGKVLESKINSLKSELSEIKQDFVKKELIITHPILREKWEEFEEFRTNPENKGMNMKTAAKAFLIENEVLEKPRLGLEKPTGGSRTPSVSGMTADEIKNLRQTNFKRYQQLLREGKLELRQ